VGFGGWLFWWGWYQREEGPEPTKKGMLLSEAKTREVFSKLKKKVNISSGRRVKTEHSWRGPRGESESSSERETVDLPRKPLTKTASS